MHLSIEPEQIKPPTDTVLTQYGLLAVLGLLVVVLTLFYFLPWAKPQRQMKWAARQTTSRNTAWAVFSILILVPVVTLGTYIFWIVTFVIRWYLRRRERIRTQAPGALKIVDRNTTIEPQVVDIVNPSTGRKEEIIVIDVPDTRPALEVRTGMTVMQIPMTDLRAVTEFFFDVYDVPGEKLRDYVYQPRETAPGGGYVVEVYQKARSSFQVLKDDKPLLTVVVRKGTVIQTKFQDRSLKKKPREA